MKFAVIITQAHPEQVFTALRFANFARNQGDQVTVFLTAEGVEAVRLDDDQFDIKEQTTTFVHNGGEILSCGTCMKLRDLVGSDTCSLSTMQGLYDLVVSADKVVTF